MRRSGWRAYVCFGGALAIVYYLVPPTVATFVVWPVIGFSSAVAILVGIRLNRPDHPLPWLLFALGQLSFALGDTLSAVREQWLDEATAAYPAVADVLYMVFFPCLVIGLLLLIRQRRSPGRDTTSLIDATIIATGIALLAWVFLVVPQFHGPQFHAIGVSAIQRTVSIAYPLADLLVLAVASRLAVGSGDRPPAWAIMMGSLVALLAADVSWGLLRLDGTWRVGGPADLGWIAFYIGWGAAALHPSMAWLSRPAPASVRLSRGRLVLITAASLIAPATLAIQAARGKPLEVPVIAGGSAVLFLLALARMSGLAGELALQQERKRAMQSVLRMTEAERSRLAAELHDGPVQQLTAMLYELELARHHVRAGSTGDADQMVATLEGKAAGEISGLRRLMTQLRLPVLDQQGLVPALRSHCRAFEASSGVACAVDADPGLRLDPDVETVLYRVALESLTNVGKHAGASLVRISLEAADGAARLLIHDDGVGFDPVAAMAMADQGHFGLVNMRERVELIGGRLRVDSAPGGGTTIGVTVGRQISGR